MDRSIFPGRPETLRANEKDETLMTYNDDHDARQARRAMAYDATMKAAERAFEAWKDEMEPKLFLDRRRIAPELVTALKRAFVAGWLQGAARSARQTQQD